MKILVLTGLYPNSIQTRHGVFVEERLRSLLSTGEATARVIAPVPWFPFKHPSFGRYADFASIPAREVRHGIEILHPRYLVIPRIGMTLGPTFMVMAVAPVMKQMLAESYDFDLIDAHYFYPDGVAANRLGRKFGKPTVVTARGTDVNTIAKLRVPGRQIVRASQQLDAVVTVSKALKRTLVELGVRELGITTLRNGVDLTRFAPTARDQVRAELNVTGPIWLAVGNLIELKGMHLAIEALASVPDGTLLIAGKGSEEGNLHALAERSGVANRVRFLGLVAHADLPRYYSAADALILATRSEGMPNVVLEAIACGTAVIATAVGGIPEVIEEPTAGVLMDSRTSEAVVAAWHKLCEYGLGRVQRDARRHYAQHFSWSETTQGQLALFRRILDDNGTSDRTVDGRSSADVEPIYEDGRF